MPCSNEAETRNPLKFTWVPQKVREVSRGRAEKSQWWKRFVEELGFKPGVKE